MFVFKCRSGNAIAIKYFCYHQHNNDLQDSNTALSLFDSQHGEFYEHKAIIQAFKKLLDSATVFRLSVIAADEELAHFHQGLKKLIK